jgi:hypothetical protein
MYQGMKSFEAEGEKVASLRSTIPYGETRHFDFTRDSSGKLLFIDPAGTSVMRSADWQVFPNIPLTGTFYGPTAPGASASASGHALSGIGH